MFYRPRLSHLFIKPQYTSSRWSLQFLRIPPHIFPQKCFCILLLYVCVCFVFVILLLIFGYPFSDPLDSILVPCLVHLSRVFRRRRWTPAETSQETLQETSQNFVFLYILYIDNYLVVLILVATQRLADMLPLRLLRSRGACALAALVCALGSPSSLANGSCEGWLCRRLCGCPCNELNQTEWPLACDQKIEK